MTTPRRWRDRGQRGAAAVEFALIILPFSVLLLGMIQYSFVFFSGQSGATAAREAARRAAVGDQTCAQLTTAVNDATQLEQSGSVTVTRRYYAPTISPITSSSPERAASAIKTGDNVRIVLTYKVTDLNFPVIPMPAFGGVRAKLQETAVARVETVTANTVAC